MKTVILCGGKGLRIRDVSDSLPKPMIKIGSHPILHHIMKIYSKYNFNKFILCTGYKSEVIINYFKLYEKK
jgi:glucose-1-phosphate cytidylyltransferase